MKPLIELLNNMYLFMLFIYQTMGKNLMLQDLLSFGSSRWYNWLYVSGSYKTIIEKNALDASKSSSFSHWWW